MLNEQTATACLPVTVGKTVPVVIVTIVEKGNTETVAVDVT